MTLDEQKRNSKFCVVVSTKRNMYVYEALYILGLLFVLIGALLEYYWDKEGYLIGSIIDATFLFVLATIIWAIDRKCVTMEDLERV